MPLAYSQHDQYLGGIGLAKTRFEQPERRQRTSPQRIWSPIAHDQTHDVCMAWISAQAYDKGLLPFGPVLTQFPDCAQRRVQLLDCRYSCGESSYVNIEACACTTRFFCLQWLFRRFTAVAILAGLGHWLCVGIFWNTHGELCRLFQ